MEQHLTNYQISVDPGLTCSGVCLWRDGEAQRFHTYRPNGHNPHEKMKNLFLLFKDMIRSVEKSSRIMECAIEDIPPFVNPKRQSALFKLAKAAAYIEMAFVEANIPIKLIKKERRSKEMAKKLASEQTSLVGSQHAYDAFLIGVLAGYSNVKD